MPPGHAKGPTAGVPGSTRSLVKLAAATNRGRHGEPAAASPGARPRRREYYRFR